MVLSSPAPFSGDHHLRPHIQTLSPPWGTEEVGEKGRSWGARQPRGRNEKLNDYSPARSTGKSPERS